uniref:hypothetical protein n=1 Tax=unclassified Variovorax TaxID=663243 RepID=UPI000D36332C
MTSISSSSNASDTQDNTGNEHVQERRAAGWSALPIVLALALLGCQAFADPSRGFETRVIETLAVLADHGPTK